MSWWMIYIGLLFPLVLLFLVNAIGWIQQVSTKSTSASSLAAVDRQDV